jgi:poly(3-hydroxybutyrate) depolymerase
MTATAGAAGTMTGGGRGGAGGGGSGGVVAGGSGGGGGTAPLPLKNPPVKSSGCDKATSVTSGEKMIMSDGKQRSYTIDVPANYDMTKPYKLVYASHWIGSNDESVVSQNYYHLKPKAQAANDSVIFLAPQALPGNPNGTWASGRNDDVDHVFFDDILAFVKSNLCIDTTRVFAIGFSFGGMQTYSLSVNHQKDIRAAVGIAPANYNIYVPPKTGQRIAWMQTTGMGDGTCPWVRQGSTTDGAKFIALEHAKDNGCTIPADVPSWKSGGFLCYDFEGCAEGYPTKACTFNGGHVSTDGQPWIAEEAWKFFSQF